MIKFSLLVFTFSFIGLLPAQSSLDSLDSDELFLRARDLAFAGSRDSARVLLKAALVKSPTYADLRILLARTFAWDGRRNEAREELRIVLRDNPKYADALRAAIDVEIWDDQLSSALTLVNQALRFFPNDEIFLETRAKIYRDMNRDQEALITVSILEDLNRSNPNIEPLRASIKTKGILNTISAAYSYDWTSESVRPHQIVTMQYSRSTPLGSLFAKVNMADRRQTTAFQYEAEWYPPIFDGIYGYLNYGYSDTSGVSLFPAHRIGVELFFSLPAKFEGSIGSRHLYFDPKPVNIYTGSLGYYFGNYWFSLRTYITPGNVSFSRSLSLTVRQYFGAEGDYLFAKIGGGISPDEDRLTDGGNLYNLRSQGIGAGVQYVIGPVSSVGLSFDYADQELSYNRGSFMDVFSLYASYRHKF